MSDRQNPGASPSQPRKSGSAEAARKAELERIVAMTPVERMALALSLGRRRLELEQKRRESGAV